MKSFNFKDKEQAVIAVAVSQFAGQIQQDPNAFAVLEICKSILDRIGKLDQNLVNSLGGNVYEQSRSEVQPANK